MKRVGSLCALLVCACGGAAPGGDGGNPADPDAAPVLPDAPLPPVAVAPAPDFLPAADPKLEGFEGWPLAFAVETGGREGLTCRIHVRKQDTSLALFEGLSLTPTSMCEVVWPALDTVGVWLRVGPVTADVEILQEGEVVATTSATLEIVRLGLSEIRVEEPEPNTRVPLMYGELAGQIYGWWEIPATRSIWKIGPTAAEGPGAVTLEHGDGDPRALPEIWTDLKSPPLDAAQPDGVEARNVNWPTAWVAGSLVRLVAKLSADVAGEAGGGAPTQTAIRLVPPAGYVPDVEPLFAHGVEVALTSVESPAPAVGRYDTQLEWRFEAQGSGGVWVPIPGHVTTWHRFYGVVAQPMFASTSLPHRPWVEVVDFVASAVDGVSADPQAVATEIVDSVYWFTDLHYDQAGGASAYTEYSGFGFNGQTFYLSRFQRRDWGNIINCSDAASIAATYANMVGIDFRYHILDRTGGGSFDLNYIRAIGTAEFDETPFLNGGGSFNYHAIVGPSGGLSYDATLLLDGDGTPTASPFTPLLPAAMDPTEYLIGLSSQWNMITTTHDERVVLQ